MRPNEEKLNDVMYELGANDMYTAEHERIDSLIEE